MPKFCAHLGYLFTEMPFHERFACAQAAGFEAIEHPDPYGIGIDRFASLANSCNMPVAQIAAPSGDPSRGEKGLACQPGRTEEFRESVIQGIDAARRIRAKALHLMSGVIPEGRKREDLRDVYVANVIWAADIAADAGVPLIIEAISDETVSGFYLNDPRFALDLLDEIARPNASLLFDTFHAAVKGIDIIDFAIQHSDRIGHIQIADHPGRNEPGSGILPFQEFFQALDDIGYAGWVGCEYKPVGLTKDGLGWLASIGK